MVFELNLYELFESYDLFFNDKLKDMKSITVPWWQTARNGHIIMCLIILLNSNKDQKILYAQINEFIYTVAIRTVTYEWLSIIRTVTYEVIYE